MCNYSFIKNSQNNISTLNVLKIKKDYNNPQNLEMNKQNHLKINMKKTIQVYDYKLFIMLIKKNIIINNHIFNPSITILGGKI